MATYVSDRDKARIRELHEQGVGPLSIAVRLNLKAHCVRVALSNRPHPISKEPIQPLTNCVILEDRLWG